MPQSEFNFLIKSIVSVLRILPGIFVTFFTLYFAWRKIFHKIIFSYSITLTGFSATRIDDIILINKKDRVEVIKKINLVFDNKYRLSIIKLKHPQIIKPFETISFNTNEVTSFSLNDGSEINISEILETKNYYFEIITSDKIIKIPKNKRRHCRKIKQDNLIDVRTNTELFNNVVINESVLYAIIYKKNNVDLTAFIQDNGFISGEWNYRYNVIPKDLLANKQKVIDYFRTTQFNDFLEKYKIIDLKKDF